MLLDEAVAHAIQAEAQTQEPGVSKSTINISRQCEKQCASAGERRKPA